MTGWIRLAAVSTLFLALAAVPAAASSGNSSGGGSISGETTTTTTSATTTAGASNAVTAPVTSTDATTAPATSSGSALGALNLAPHAFGSRLLSVGSRGTDVVALQHDLNALGFTTSASGTFSRQTRSQLTAFQRRYRLTVDGVAGPSSITKLKRLLSSSLHIAETANVSATSVATTPAPSMPLSAADSGGVGFIPAAPVTDATVQDATLVDGLAIPAPGTPEAIVQVIEAANKIAFDPYIYGGGHASFTAAGYDCSGSVSYALHGGGLLATPLDSEQFAQYGESGLGNWITIYTNGPSASGSMGHAYMEIAGLWFDTAAQSANNGMDRWSTTRVNEPSAYGTFEPRHPAGW